MSLRKASPIGNNLGRKAIFVSICILIFVTLVAFMGNFGSINTIVRADSIKGIGVGIYWDQACTNKTLSLNWKFIDIGSKDNLKVYIRNEANWAVSLWLGTSNWTPSASSTYISLKWNYSGQVLSVNQVIPLELTLTVSPTIIDITDFSFNTVINITKN
jgi:hypothetical protein